MLGWGLSSRNKGDSKSFYSALVSNGKNRKVVFAIQMTDVQWSNKVCSMTIPGREAPARGTGRETVQLRIHIR